MTMVRPNIHCPSCDTTLPPTVVRKLSPFWKTVQAVACPECGNTIQWHQSLHKKMKLGGGLFKVGLFVAITSVPLFFLIEPKFAKLTLSVGVLGLFLGFFGTSTKPEDLRLEVVE